MTESPWRRRSANHCWAIALVALSALACSSGDDDDDDDDTGCDIIPPTRTQQYGQQCQSVTAEGCITTFDDCVEGTCLETSNGTICSNDCTYDPQCPGDLYCAPNGDATMACTLPAQCGVVCDGQACCTYEPIPGDPTSCALKSCETGGHG